MKKIIAVILSLVCILNLTACGSSPKQEAGTDEKPAAESPAGDSLDNSKEKVRMAMIMPLATQDFFNFIAAQLQYEADQANVDLTMWDINGDVSKIGDLVEMAKEQEYDLMFVIDPTGSAKSAMEEVQGDIVLIGFDAVVNPELQSAWISTDNVAMGRLLAEHMIDDMRAAGKDSYNVILTFTPTVQSEIDRKDGMIEAIEAVDDMEIHVEEASNSKVDLAGKVSLWDDLLVRKAEGEIDYVLGTNSYNALGCVSAAEAAGRYDFKVMGIDDEEDQLAALQKEGEHLYYATVAQNPFQIGKEMMRAALAALNGEELGTIGVDGVLVTSDNVDGYLAERSKNIEALSDYISIISQLN